MKEIYNCHNDVCSCSNFNKKSNMSSQLSRNSIKYNNNGVILDVDFSVFNNGLESAEVHDGEHPGGQLTVDINSVKDQLGNHVNITDELDEKISDFILDSHSNISLAQAEGIVKEAGYIKTSETNNIKIFKKGSSCVIISGKEVSKSYIYNKVNK